MSSVDVPIPCSRKGTTERGSEDVQDPRESHREPEKRRSGPQMGRRRERSDGQGIDSAIGNTKEMVITFRIRRIKHSQTDHLE